MEKIVGVILAAGKGTRMNEGQAAPIPKVMFEINGAPMIRYSVDNVLRAGVKTVAVVVGYKQELIRDFLGDEVLYAVQAEQLGTGHAVAQVKALFEAKSEAVLVCYGDMPLFDPQTIENLIQEYEKEKPTVALLSVDFAEPEKWAFGRIVRNEKGEVIDSIEQKDCTSEQLKIKESNTCFYIFQADWLWQNITKLGTNNAQHEYYLTDLVGLARDQGKRIIAVKMENENEAMGVNTPKQLALAERVLGQRV